MIARLDLVCKFICERGNWAVTNLQLQKILYLSYMYYMGESNGEKLTNALFEAWDFGPVEPTVYRKVRIFGANAIQDIFYGARHFKIDDARQMALMEVCDALLPLRPSALVNITHWKDGAWAHSYVPGTRGIRIFDPEIALEYRRRVEAYSHSRSSADYSPAT